MMLKFYFQGINNDGKKLSGFVLAENKNMAREKLSKMGFAILSLDIFSEEKKEKSNLKLFNFQGIDKNKKIMGNIESKNEYEAYKKLRSEYNFEITSLIPANLPPDQKHKLLKQKINPDLQKLYEEEKHLTKKEDDSTKTREQRVEELVKLREKRIDIIRIKIIDIVNQIQALLRTRSNLIKPGPRRELLDRLGLLSRLRQSNSIEHLENLTQKILNQLTDETILIEPEEDDSKEKILKLDKEKKEFKKSVGKSLDYFKENIIKFEISFAKIDTQNLKTTILNIRLFYQFFDFLYLIFVFLGGLFSIFWITNLIQFILQKNLDFVYYYVNSGFMWYFTTLSIFIALFFKKIIFAPDKFSLVAKSVVTSVGIFIIFIFTINFPGIFYWT